MFKKVIIKIAFNVCCVAKVDLKLQNTHSSYSEMVFS